MLINEDLIIDQNNLQIMEFKVLKRDGHDFIQLYKNFYRSAVLKEKVYLELSDVCLDLYLDKEWVLFKSKKDFDKKVEKLKYEIPRGIRYFDIDKKISKDFLRSHNECIFVYGDNLIRKGTAGAAEFRNEINSYGVITKKYPSMDDKSFYRPEEYVEVFKKELNLLINKMICEYNKIFLISKIGAGLANRYNIFEYLIIHGLSDEIINRKMINNCIFLFNIDDEINKADIFMRKINLKNKEKSSRISLAYSDGNNSWLFNRNVNEEYNEDEYDSEDDEDDDREDDEDEGDPSF